MRQGVGLARSSAGDDELGANVGTVVTSLTVFHALPLFRVQLFEIGQRHRVGGMGANGPFAYLNSRFVRNAATRPSQTWGC